MQHRLIPIVAISFIWAAIFNLSKKVTQLETNIIALGFIKTIILGILGTLVLVIYKYKQSQIIENIKSIDNQVWYILLLIAFLELVSGFFYYQSLKNNDVSWSIPMIEAGIVLVGITVSICVFKEQLNLFKILGIISILLGVFLFYHN